MKRLIIGGLAALAIGLGTAPMALADEPAPPPVPAFPCIPAPFIVIPGLIPGVHTCAPGEVPGTNPLDVMVGR
jgi:hypothetical protein